MTCRLLGLSMIAVALTACGGASTGGGTTFTSPPTQTYSVLFDTFIDTLDVAEGLDATPSVEIGSVGSARYEGQLFLGTRTVSTVVDAAVGHMTLDVDLASDTFDGTATGFQGRNSVGNELPAAREGSLIISDGTLQRSNTGALMQADVGGTLQFYNDTREMDGTMTGFIRGDDAGYASGDVDIGFAVDPITLSGTNIVIDRLTLEGGFVAERK